MASKQGSLAPLAKGSSNTGSNNSSSSNINGSSNSHSALPRTTLHQSRSPHAPQQMIPNKRKFIGHYDIADQTFQLLSRHRAAACVLFWSLTILLDILLQLPIEWFFLFYFILALVFRIFFIGGHIVLISIGAMCVTNAIVYYTVPFSFTSPFATGVAFGLMVSLIHGLNLKGVILAMTMYMLKPYLERQTFIEALNPPTLPSMVILAPLAAFCSAFGVLWLLYDLFGYLHASTDDLRDFFGITQPSPSIVTLKEVKDRSITLTWQCASQATISKHLIEIDGLLVGESGKQETSVVIQGLYPDNVYRIRLWAITTRNWKTPSDYIVVRTLASVPIELELSSAENTRKEGETDNQPTKDQETSSATTDPQGGTDTSATTSTTASTETATTLAKSDSAAAASVEELTPATANIPTECPPTQPVLVETKDATSSTKAQIPMPEQPSSPVITEHQLEELRSELAAKDNHYAALLQHIKDTEEQYKRKEEQFRKEITRLRELQKAEEEPRQQAKNKMKELQDSLRETELLKSKIEKEHKAEMEKRQKAQGQLDAKNKMLENLRKSLSEKEARLKSEKETHQRQKKQLEQTLEQRTQDVKAAMASLTELQSNQAALKKAIEDKEKELTKLQTALNPPKSQTPSPLEMTKRELDQKNTELLEQLEQYRRENQQLQERLLEATKGVAKAREAQAKAEAQFMQQEVAATPKTEESVLGGTWTLGDWSQGLGPFLWQGIVQDDTSSPLTPPSTRKGADSGPPGLQPNISNDNSSSLLFSSSKPFLPPSPSQAPQHSLNRQHSGHPKKSWSSQVVAEHGRSDATSSPPLAHLTPRSQAVRPRSTSIISTDSIHAGMGLEDASSPKVTSTSIAPTSQAARTHNYGRIDRSVARSRTSSISSLNSIQSPLFENSTLFGLPGQHQQQQLQGQQRPHSIHASQTKYLGTSQLQSPSGAHTSTWGQTSQSGKIDSPGTGGDSRLHQHIVSYPRYFGSPFLMENAPPAGPNGRLIDEKNVIQSMFESPDCLDLRTANHHHLRTMASHGSLSTQARVLPSHLRSVSTPGSSQSSPPICENGSNPGMLSSLPQPLGDPKAVARPGTLGRLSNQASSSVTSLHSSDTPSPTSPPGFTHSQSTMNQSVGVTVSAGSSKESGRRAAGDATLDRDGWSSSTAFGPSPFLFQHPNSSASSLNSPHGSVSFGLDAPLALGGDSGGFHRETSRLNNDYSDWSSGGVGTSGSSNTWDSRIRSSDLSQQDRRVTGAPGVVGTDLDGNSLVSKSGLSSPLTHAVNTATSTTTTSNSGSSRGATSSTIDALSFADHYFSSRTQRGFEAPSSLAAAGLSTPANASFMHTTITHGSGNNGPLTSANTYAPTKSFVPRVTSRTASMDSLPPTSISSTTSLSATSKTTGDITTTTASNGTAMATSNQSPRLSSDAFGFGLWFNPLEWSTNVSEAPNPAKESFPSQKSDR
ncbi:hypothetical protein BGW41_005671 [Actinomortierella wolfii]|nr:hypothetical protein BGW41_005671 [Actinomortierella wolfii]